ncbi:copper chaperone PCu(A)C [Paracoccus alkanivorans]|uniref:Copper chaperone PCu(A)C n=1 Tax=Paracoccus alkanivorans TaxID=2116655 RepID=A0A3M0LXU2_9RHOB|nr:copper chaperone PCu(A)C [Paracoccus alkanivorans]RMC30318.1 copper chaperone PCu(A)C [Paracoccus alkanivorans]
MKTMAFAAAAVLVPCAALAHDGMAVKDAYARGANPKSGAAFMLLENHRKVDCTLQGAASDAAERVLLHTSEETDGVMKMQSVEGITIPAEGEYLMQRGGDHVMMMGLKAPLEDGQTVKLTLDFGDCGSEEIEVPVDNQRGADHVSHDDAEEAGTGHEGH